MSEAMTSAVITLIAALATLLVALAAFFRAQASAVKVDQVSHRTNGLLDKLLAEARAEGYRAGMLDGQGRCRKPPETLPPGPSTS